MTNKLMKFCEESGLLRQHDVSNAEYKVDDTKFIKWQLDELQICSIKWEIAENRIRTAVDGRLDYIIAAAHGAGLYRKLCSIMDLKELFNRDELYRYKREKNNYAVIDKAVREAEALEEDYIFTKDISYADIISANFSIYCTSNDSLRISALTYEGVRLIINAKSYKTGKAYEVIKMLASEMFRLALSMYEIEDIKDTRVPDIFHALYTMSLKTNNSTKSYKGTNCIIQFSADVPDMLDERRKNIKKLIAGYRCIKESSTCEAGKDEEKADMINKSVGSIAELKAYFTNNAAEYKGISTESIDTDNLKKRIEQNMSAIRTDADIRSITYSIETLVDEDDVFDIAGLSCRHSEDNTSLIVERKLSKTGNIVYMPLFILIIKSSCEETAGTTEVEICAVAEVIALSAKVKTGLDKSMLISITEYMLQVAVCGMSCFEQLKAAELKEDACGKSESRKLFDGLIHTCISTGSKQAETIIKDTHYSVNAKAEFICELHTEADTESGKKSKEVKAYSNTVSDGEANSNMSFETEKDRAGDSGGAVCRSVESMCREYGISQREYRTRLKLGESKDSILREASARMDKKEKSMEADINHGVFKADKGIELTKDGTALNNDSTGRLKVIKDAEHHGKIRSIVNIGCRFIIVGTEDGKLYSAGYNEIKDSGIFPVERISMDEIVEYNGIEVSDIELKERRFAEPDTDAVKEILKHFWD